MTELIERLRQWKSETPPNVKGLFMWSSDVPCPDFNREIAEPGKMADFPDGAVGIRVDDDFWLVASLPYEFRGLTIQQIVAVLWPDIPEPEFNEDSSA